MTAIPPSRYKVVERGRRLVVIDTRTGQPARDDPPSPAAARRADPPVPVERRKERPIADTAPRRVDDRSGAAVFTTARFYDDKAPREIVADDRFNTVMAPTIAMAMVGAFCLLVFAVMTSLWLLLLPFLLLAQPKVRAAIRGWITARLDDVQAAS